MSLNDFKRLSGTSVSTFEWQCRGERRLGYSANQFSVRPQQVAECSTASPALLEAAGIISGCGMAPLGPHAGLQETGDEKFKVMHKDRFGQPTASYFHDERLAEQFAGFHGTKVLAVDPSKR